MAIRTNRRLNRWGAKGAIAGLIGGIPMALYMMLVCVFTGLGLLYPLNAIATNWVRFRPAGAGFAPGATLTGTLEHLIMSALWGAGLYGVLWLSDRMTAGTPRRMLGTWTRTIGAGVFWGALAFSTTGVVIGPALSPDLLWLPRGHWFISHLIYGVVTAAVLRAWLGRPQFRVTFAPGETAVTRERVHSGGE